MRFEPERMGAHIKALDHTRPPGSAEERRAAEYVADQLSKSGYNVTRTKVLLSRHADLLANRVSWLVIGLVTTLQTILTTGSSSLFAWFVFEGAGLFCWVLATHLSIWIGFPLPPLDAAECVVGGWTTDPPSPARIVYLTNLDSDPKRWPRQLTRLLELLTLFMMIVISLQNLRPAHGFARSSRFGLLAMLWALVVARAVEGIIPISSTRVYDNRSGLAALLELARTLPASVKDRLEIEFLALPLGMPSAAGARNLADRHGGDRLGQATLFIRLIEPDQRKELILAGQGPSLELAQAAAKGLWIPHQVVRSFSLGLDASLISLVGDVALERDRMFGHRVTGPVEPDQASSAGAVQLATEIALRWARLHGQPDGDARLAKSSQNPG